MTYMNQTQIDVTFWIGLVMWLLAIVSFLLGIAASIVLWNVTWLTLSSVAAILLAVVGWIFLKMGE